MRKNKGFVDYWWPCPNCGSPSRDLVKWSGVMLWKRGLTYAPDDPRFTISTQVMGHYECEACWSSGDYLQILKLEPALEPALQPVVNLEDGQPEPAPHPDDGLPVVEDE